MTRLMAQHDARSSWLAAKQRSSFLHGHQWALPLRLVRHQRGILAMRPHHDTMPCCPPPHASPTLKSSSALGGGRDHCKKQVLPSRQSTAGCSAGGGRLLEDGLCGATAPQQWTGSCRPAGERRQGKRARTGHAAATERGQAARTARASVHALKARVAPDAGDPSGPGCTGDAGPCGRAAAMASSPQSTTVPGVDQRCVRRIRNGLTYPGASAGTMQDRPTCCSSWMQGAGIWR